MFGGSLPETGEINVPDIDKKHLPDKTVISR
jgi:hypothetical protein